MKIIQDYIAPGRRNRPTTYKPSGIYGLKMAPRFLTIHETDNIADTATAANHAIWLKTANNLQVGYHFTVDDSGAWKHLPLDEPGWHCGDGVRGTGNRESIGIEICVNALPEDNLKYLKAVDNAALLAAKLIKEVPSLIQFPECLKQHHDWSGKNCPTVIRSRNIWSAFVSTVKDYLQDSKPKPEPLQQDVWYRVIAGSYRDRSNAEMVRQTLLSQGIGAFIEIYRG